jgi:hypothetical protein
MERPPFIRERGGLTVPLLIILALMFFMPWLGFMLLLIVGLFLVVMIPLGFAASSFFWALAGPSQLFKMLFDKKVRKNHALEHATARVLSYRGYPGLAGEADGRGFSIRGLPDPSLVFDAAKEARDRLVSGESELAIHPRCGTTVVVVNTLSSLIFIALLIATGSMSLLSVILALVVAQFLGPMVSPWVQRHVTTDPDVRSLRVAGVELRSSNRVLFGAAVRMADSVYVSTVDDSGVIDAEVV